MLRSSGRDRQNHEDSYDHIFSLKPESSSFEKHQGSHKPKGSHSKYAASRKCTRQPHFMITPVMVKFQRFPTGGTFHGRVRETRKSLVRKVSEQTLCGYVSWLAAKGVKRVDIWRDLVSQPAQHLRLSATVPISLLFQDLFEQILSANSQCCKQIQFRASLRRCLCKCLKFRNQTMSVSACI